MTVLHVITRAISPTGYPSEIIEYPEEGHMLVFSHAEEILIATSAGVTALYRGVTASRKLRQPSQAS
jgi:hypothetical protein